MSNDLYATWIVTEDYRRTRLAEAAEHRLATAARAGTRRQRQLRLRMVWSTRSASTAEGGSAA